MNKFPTMVPTSPSVTPMQATPPTEQLVMELGLGPNSFQSKSLHAVPLAWSQSHIIHGDS